MFYPCSRVRRSSSRTSRPGRVWRRRSSVQGKRPARILLDEFHVSGMPAYQISAVYAANLVQYLDKVVQLGLPTPANMVFRCDGGFYFLLIVPASINGFPFWVLPHAFSSYFFIYIEAGTIPRLFTRSHYMALVVAGLLPTFGEGCCWGRDHRSGARVGIVCQSPSDHLLPLIDRGAARHHGVVQCVPGEPAWLLLQGDRHLIWSQPDWLSARTSQPLGHPGVR